MDFFNTEMFTAIVTALGPVAGWVILILIVIWSLQKVGIMPLILTSIKSKVDLKRKQMHLQKDSMDFQNHTLFPEIKVWLRRKLKHLDFGDEERNFIFRDVILKRKLHSIYKHGITPTKDVKSLNELSVTEFTIQVKQAVDDIIEEYNKNIVSDLQLRYGDAKGTKVFNLVMHTPIRGFNVHHESIVEFLLSLINSICISSMYDSNTERYWAILNVYSAAVTSTFIDVEKTFHLFNGELTNLIKQIDE